MKKFSFSSIIRKQQPKGVFIEAIWKYWHRHLSISIVIGIGIAKKLFLPSEFLLFFKKSRIFMLILCIVMVSVPLCYKYLVLYNFLFIQWNASIGVLEKSYLNIWRHPPWCFKKATAPKISSYFAYFPAIHPGLSSF